VSFAVLLTIYTVGWLSGVCSVLFYDLMKLIKGK